jgi:hypothetical protein
MKRKVLEKAIKLNDSINNIDRSMTFLSKYERYALEIITTDCRVCAPRIELPEEVKDVLIETMSQLRQRLIDELDKL